MGARLLCESLIGRALTPHEKHQYFSDLEAIGFIQQLEIDFFIEDEKLDVSFDNLSKLISSYEV
jgi:hypothetical protein